VLAESCVFDKQSLPPALCYLFPLQPRGLHVPEACLIPKLRQQYAKFLNSSSLKRLGILYPPTCVGFRYGHILTDLEDFLGSMGSVTLLGLPRESSSRLGLNVRVDFPAPTAYTLKPGLFHYLD